MLPMNDLNHTIKQIEAKHIFMAFDSCYSGLGLQRSIKRRPRQDSAYIQKMMQSVNAHVQDKFTIIPPKKLLFKRGIDFGKHEESLLKEVEKLQNTFNMKLHDEYIEETVKELNGN